MPTGTGSKQTNGSGAKEWNLGATELAERMGSKDGYNPIPPSQHRIHRWSKDPVWQLVGWMYDRTIEYGHRSPHATDDKGRELGITDLANDLGWKVPYASLIFAQAEEKGLVKKDGRRLLLRGDVPLPESPPPKPGKKPKVNCTINFASPFLRLLNPTQLAEWQALEPKVAEIADKFEAEAIRLARIRSEELVAKLFEDRFGVQIERPPESEKKRRGRKPKPIEYLTLSFIYAPEVIVQKVAEPIVQKQSESVQTQELSVQNGFDNCTETPSLYTEKTEKTEKNREGVVLSESPKPTPDPAPPPAPSSAVATPEPEREYAFDIWRQIMDGCGKPVAVQHAAAARAKFFKYPLDVQQHIVEDALLRAELKWNEPKWTPDPLDYLNSRDWDLKPIKRRSFPTPASGRQQQREEAIRRLYERTAARTKKGGAS
jgi:hypothetical protein